MKLYCIIAFGLFVLLFYKSFQNDYVLFSNDSPYGMYASLQSQEVGAAESWAPNNWLGETTLPAMGVSSGLRIVLGETHHTEWDEAAVIGAIHSTLCLLFPFLIIGASLYKSRKGERL